ncbi:MAG TPA: hypothetical protein PKD20_02400 [Candidatus Saccharibacteria bacterium]|jgi:hypothetical protein|nr:hypothetical protein [Candidatus Saccharibacteria bacterium]HMT55704.1 hypothetical protein [Candidatus Saccharibacteria bacterium]
MAHTYSIYKFVRAVNKTNDENMQAYYLEIIRRSKLDGKDRMKGVQAPPYAVAKSTMCALFLDKRILLKKIGFNYSSQLADSAVKNKYLREVRIELYPTYVTEGLVLTDKGLKLIDGSAFFRPGLWKVLYIQHGWLKTIIPFGLITATIPYIIQRVAHSFVK